MIARKLLEALVGNPDLEDMVEDYALDFVEQRVGRFDFQNNWETFSDKEGSVRRWLTSTQRDPGLTSDVVEFLNKLRNSDLRWLY